MPWVVPPPPIFALKGHQNRPNSSCSGWRIKSLAPLQGALTFLPHHLGHRSSNSLSPGLWSSGPLGRRGRTPTFPARSQYGEGQWGKSGSIGPGRGITS
jgi:hypothetical protein